jgi:FKBP-type peptidyl-prolyl cis-trans isomerase SlpA
VSDSNEILPGSAVTLHLRILLEDGSEVLSTFDEEPLSLVMGDGMLQPGLELALYGLKPRDTQTLNLMPDQAYGPRNPALIQQLPRTDFATDFEPERGQVIAFQLPDGEETAGIVLEVDEGRVEVDFNHPLAGHEITFSVEILEVGAPATPGNGT